MLTRKQNMTDISMSITQIKEFAAAIMLGDIKSYISENRAEYEAFSKAQERHDIIIDGQALDVSLNK